MPTLRIDPDHPETWPEFVLVAAARELGRRGPQQREHNNGGRKPNPQPCRHCGDLYSGRARREHERSCFRKKEGDPPSGSAHA